MFASSFPTSSFLFQVSQDAMNMIEYVMDRFLDLAHLSPELCANFLYTANMAAAECSLLKGHDGKMEKERDSTIVIANGSSNGPGTSDSNSTESTEMKPPSIFMKAKSECLPRLKSPPQLKPPSLIKMEVLEEQEHRQMEDEKAMTAKESSASITEWKGDETNCLLTIYLTRCASKCAPALTKGASDQWMADILLDLSDSGIHKTRLDVMKELNRLGLIQDSALEQHPLPSAEKPLLFISKSSVEPLFQRSKEMTCDLKIPARSIRKLTLKEGLALALFWLNCNSR